LSVLYPAFLTAKTITQEDVFSRDGKLYLSYWVCFAFLGIFQSLFSWAFRFIPFSRLGMCLFTLWLYNSRTRGAEWINMHLFHPILSKFGAQKHFENAKETVKEHTS